MSDPNTPNDPPPAPPAPQPPAQPPKPGPAGPPRRQFPQGDRPRQRFDDKPQPPPDYRLFNAMKPNTRDLDTSIEAEMAAALAGFDVSGTVVEEKGKKEPPKPGVQPKKKGRIVAINGPDVFVDVPGGRGQGMLPLLQFEAAPPVIGQEVEFDIERYDAANGLLLLTMTGAATVVTDWSSVTRGAIVEAKVTGVNKNRTGLTVEVNGIKGFLPLSQMDLYRVEDPDQFLNQKIKCEVIELNPEERNLVVSRRSILEREREQNREAFWAGIAEGQTRTGIVKSIKPFGAFVDLGGADGLIPIGELSWERIDTPEAVVKVGQKVEVIVARLDPEARKIGLSLRALTRSPWDVFAEEHKPGTRVTGKVTRIADFGAFVEVAPGVEGLVHVSELSTMRVRKVRDAVSEGQVIAVEIQSIDTQARRMSLSLKSLQAEAEAAEVAKTAAEKEADLRAAEERLAARKANPNLRGGIGSGKPLFDVE